MQTKTCQATKIHQRHIVKFFVRCIVQNINTTYKHFWIIIVVGEALAAGHALIRVVLVVHAHVDLRDAYFLPRHVASKRRLHLDD